VRVLRALHSQFSAVSELPAYVQQDEQVLLLLLLLLLIVAVVVGVHVVDFRLLQVQAQEFLNIWESGGF
jgi:hypothetical protein